MKRETQLLNDDEMVVYEAVTIARKATLGTLVHATGMRPEVVERAVDHLADLEFVFRNGEEVELGPNEWDLPHLQS